VLKGVASPKLLETYEAERKPVGKFTVEQAYTRYVTRTATYLGAKDFQPPANDFNIELGYLYKSPAVVPEEGADDKTHDDPHVTQGRAGSRAPHVWLDRGGRKISSLDLVGTRFVLLAASQGKTWCEAARAAAKDIKGIELDATCVGAEIGDPDGAFEQAYGLSPTGAVLVRPDGFIGWRAKESASNPRKHIDGALNAILGNA
jgi:putative polyketide hydroxylase